ncbi:hypothetical protein [Amycolatopsis sp. DSM 110486]|uniref:hypothetical protein n=1 Tax=Amycolatopsis sp. DSM 110486 TaxID=2865832 RepID=UPI001C6947AA|nr:hypothetical protein [Amycolatopsis sp. DSM 110486]QYN18825.1 hypothetical protein K1T34_39905 [Amycolatopsis sp. DSM 110486]
MAKLLKITVEELDELLHDVVEVGVSKSGKSASEPSAGGLVPVMVEGQAVWLPVDPGVFAESKAGACFGGGGGVRTVARVASGRTGAHQARS